MGASGSIVSNQDTSYSNVVLATKDEKSPTTWIKPAALDTMQENIDSTTTDSTVSSPSASNDCVNWASKTEHIHAVLQKLNVDTLQAVMLKQTYIMLSPTEDDSDYKTHVKKNVEYSSFAVKLDKEEDKQTCLVLSFMFKSCANGKVIIYCNKNEKVDKIVSYIKAIGVPVEGLDSDDNNGRHEVISRFIKGEIKVLVCPSYVAVRHFADGLNSKIDIVINFDIPDGVDEYSLRANIPGIRCGTVTSVVNFISSDEEDRQTKRISDSLKLSNMLPFSQFLHNN